MNRSAMPKEYWDLEMELEKVANSLGLTADQLTDNFHSQEHEVKAKVRPILWEQLKHIEVVQQARFVDQHNVLVLPLSRRRVL